MSNKDVCTTTTPHAAHSWVAVNPTRVDKCPGILELLPLNQFVGIVVINSAGRLLIVHSVKRDEWCIPGGKPEGHESLKAAARRELYEETGLQVTHYDDLRFSHESEHDVKGVRWYGTIFTCRNVCGSPKMQVPEEIDGLLWVTPECFNTLSDYAAGDLGRIFEAKL